MVQSVSRKWQLREQYNSYFVACTDGSKCEQKVAAIVFYPGDLDDPGIIRLRDGSSVFNAELEGILSALKKFLTLSKSTLNWSFGKAFVRTPANIFCVLQSL